MGRVNAPPAALVAAQRLGDLAHAGRGFPYVEFRAGLQRLVHGVIVKAGIASVPPRATTVLSRAASTVAAPPSMKPSRDRELWTNTMAPSGSPASRQIAFQVRLADRDTAGRVAAFRPAGKPGFDQREAARSDGRVDRALHPAGRSLLAARRSGAGMVASIIRWTRLRLSGGGAAIPA